MKTERSKSLLPFHYGWVILLVTFLSALIGAGIRSSSQILINPLEQDFGWGVVAISFAISVNLFLYGLGSPFAGRLIDRFGPRIVMLGCLLLMAAGVAGTYLMNSYWQFILFWGIFVGAGSGGVASVMAATVANRWFSTGRGLVLGVLNSAGSTGQLIFIPLMMSVLIGAGWRSGTLMMALVALGILVFALLWMRDDPEAVGTKPFGWKEGTPVPAPAPMVSFAATIKGAMKHPIFWFLAGSYFICGATSLGLVGTHLIPFSHDHGISPMAAAQTVGIMGAMNFIGTLLSGYLTDKIDPRKVLGFIFGLRGISLILLPFVHDFRGLMVFGVIYGLQWFATVPPVIALTADTFGKRSVGTVYGMIFLSHQIGSSIAATLAGSVRVGLGDYRVAFLLGAVFAFVGTFLTLSIPKKRAAAIQSASS